MTTNSRTKTIASLVLPLLVIPWMISNQSLWIDEGETAFFATRPNLRAWLSELSTFQVSGVQMPAYMFLAWLLGRKGLTAEWGLRAQNAVWVALAVVALWRLGRKLGMPWLGLALVLCPFVWTYADEARPYAMQIGCGAWLLSGLVSFVRNEVRTTMWAIEFGIASVLLCASHLVGFIPVLSAAVCLAGVAFLRRWRLSGSAVAALTASGLILLGLAFYYLDTLRRGIDRPRIWPVGIGNALFCLYEFGGLAAFGPPRHELREMLAAGAWLAALHSARFGFPAWLAMGASYVIIFGRALRNLFLRQIPLYVVACLALFTLGMGLLWVSARIFNFPFWGRYLAALFPCVVLIVSYVGSVGAIKSRSQTFAVAALAVLLVAGSINLRWNPRHRKDDYRAATSAALSALRSGRTVWWVASELAAQYYGLPLGYRSADRDERCIALYSPANLAGIQPSMPDLIAISKPSIYDAHGAVRTFIRDNNFHRTQSLNAFEIYER